MSCSYELDCVRALFLFGRKVNYWISLQIYIFFKSFLLPLVGQGSIALRIMVLLVEAK